MLDKGRICEKYLKILGKGITVISEDGGEHNVFAVLQQMWSKNKTKFEDSYYEIGTNFNDYYNYIGPASCDITAIGKGGYVLCDGDKYVFVRTTAIKIGKNIQFYSGVLKRVWEGDYDVFI